MSHPDFSWMEEAACQGKDADLFFPGRGPASAGEAKAICRTCPVIAPCLEFALTFSSHADTGVWGGTTERERRRIRRERRRAA